MAPLDGPFYAAIEEEKRMRTFQRRGLCRLWPLTAGVLLVVLMMTPACCTAQDVTDPKYVSQLTLTINGVDISFSKGSEKKYPSIINKKSLGGIDLGLFQETRADFFTRSGKTVELAWVNTSSEPAVKKDSVALFLAINQSAKKVTVTLSGYAGVSEALPVEFDPAKLNKPDYNVNIRYVVVLKNSLKVKDPVNKPANLTAVLSGISVSADKEKLDTPLTMYAVADDGPKNATRTIDTAPAIAEAGDVGTPPTSTSGDTAVNHDILDVTGVVRFKWNPKNKPGMRVSFISTVTVTLK